MALYLVTGGAGFIGSHIVERLVSMGEGVRVIDNFITGERKNIEFLLGQIELLEGDIRDEGLLKYALRGVDCVFHQAALRSVPKSVGNPWEYNDVNVAGTLKLLMHAAAVKVRRFIFASSSSIYGEREDFPERESDLPNPISPYAATKLCGEVYCNVFRSIYNIQTVSLRYFNVFGPRQSLESQYAVVVPKFITSLLADEQPPIYGTGRQARDFTYIDNVVDANILAATTSKIKSPVYNIACGKSWAVLQLFEEIAQIMGKDSIPKFLPPRPGDVARTEADISSACREIGYSPRVGFIEGLKRTIEWFRNNPV